MEKIIKEKLVEIEAQENVKIIGAFESGSRAWGFASPDSDYDVRFLYIRNRDDYLKLGGIRDVIEWQLDETLDINGWDIQKALRLLYKSNPTIFEWCASPIVYLESNILFQFKALLPEFFSCKKSLFHYWHMAETNYQKYLKTPEVRIKKYFYVLRPLLAAQWIIDKQCPPPMLFSELVEEELDLTIKPEVDSLLQLKKELPEMGLAPKVQILNDYIEERLVYIKDIADKMENIKSSWNELNRFFLDAIEGIYD